MRSLALPAHLAQRPVLPPTTPTDYVVYSQATGLLSCDANGNAAGGVIAFAVLTNRPMLSANDFQVI
jgi:hypothetical protein